MKFSDWSIKSKIAVPAILCFIAGTLAIVFTMSQLKNNTLELAGIKTAKSVANEIIAVRGFYTREIVKKGKKNGMKFNFDYAEHADVFPLPATLVNSLGEDIATKFPGMSIKLYSNYPFSHREKPVLDEFETAALKTLEGNPEEPVWSISKIGEKRSIRYVVPDIMKPACVGCHNSHPGSIKRNWKTGDVRGAVEVIVPLEEVEATLFSGFVEVLAVVVVIFVVLITITLYLVKKYITAQVVTLSKNFKLAANGDLSVRVDSTSTDEIGQMGIDFNHMISTFRDMVKDIRSTSEHLASSSEELSATSVQIAEGTKEQSSRAAQVSTASQEMTATIVEISQNIVGASDAANSANETATKGGVIVEQTITSMHGISTTAKESSEIISTLGGKSNEIGNIINVIDDIADQTNLLALNAAIEAARAGEQGRGFAVVADEVGKLAEKTMNATKEIGNMIKGMQSETGKAIISMENEVEVVESGVKLASEAGESLADILEQVDVVKNMIQHVSTAVEEQSSATEQISSDIESVSAVVTQTSASAQQIASASHEIAELAAKLNSKVEMFTVSGTG